MDDVALVPRRQTAEEPAGQRSGWNAFAVMCLGAGGGGGIHSFIHVLCFIPSFMFSACGNSYLPPSPDPPGPPGPPYLDVAQKFVDRHRRDAEQGGSCDEGRQHRREGEGPKVTCLREDDSDPASLGHDPLDGVWVVVEDLGSLVPDE